MLLFSCSIAMHNSYSAGGALQYTRQPVLVYAGCTLAALVAALKSFTESQLCKVQISVVSAVLLQAHPARRLARLS